MAGLSIIILGAGKGTRMVSDLSKVLHKVANLEMINHVINTAKKLNPDEICVICSEENINEIRKSVDNNTILVIQKERLGTGHAVSVGLLNLKNLNNDILVMYGDMPLIKLEIYQKLLNLLKNDDTIVANLGYKTSNTDHKWGRLIVENDKLKKIVEYKDATDEVKEINLVNAGIVAIKGKKIQFLLNKIKNENKSKEYYLTDIVEIANNENLICRYIIDNDETILGVNSKEELSIAESVFQKQKRKDFMDSGVTIIDSNSVYFSYDTEIAENVIIEPNVVFLNNVKIGKNVIIHSFSYLEGCLIEDNSSVGPFARIRPNTILKKNSHIGNFVEIKKSIVGEGTKIGHLTYIGDSNIGNNTNIGAGCITCNYDGFNKFSTAIGDNCFIGSNTIMIAPINLNDNCMTGAGSVITKDVESNDLAISRPQQINLKEKALYYRIKKSKK